MWIRKSLVTVDILYYMPDYTDIVQEFIWQTNDHAPELPRVHKVAYTYENEDRIKRAVFHKELLWH